MVRSIVMPHFVQGWHASLSLQEGLRTGLVWGLALPSSPAVICQGCPCCSRQSLRYKPRGLLLQQEKNPAGEMHAEMLGAGTSGRVWIGWHALSPRRACLLAA